jgi:hypothetical protein
MRSLSLVTLGLALAALAVCFGIALNRTGQADQSVPAGPTADETNQQGISAPATGRQAPAAEQAANSKRNRIRAKIETLGDHPWAGEYYEGDGLGANIVVILAPEAGYVYEWHGCLGLYDRNYGSVTEKGGKLVFSFEFENGKNGLRGMAPELAPVRWGDRRYLIPTGDVVGFCNSVNQGAEPRSGSYGLHLLRLGDEGKAVTGRPNVPKEFQSYLLPEPVEAKVVTVGVTEARTSWAGWDVRDTPLTLDAGAKRGLKVGMELFVTEPDSVLDSVKITKVEDDRSEAVMNQMLSKAPGPKPGWRVSTRARWYPSQ